MADNRYYLLHGIKHDSDHETLPEAIVRASKIMDSHGSSHSEIKIGDRQLKQSNDILIIYFRGVKYTRKEQS